MAGRISASKVAEVYGYFVVPQHSMESVIAIAGGADYLPLVIDRVYGSIGITAASRELMNCTSFPADRLEIVVRTAAG